MYFDNFNTLLYEFPTIGSNKTSSSLIIKDITTNIRFKKEFIESLPLVETYKIMDGDTPEIISEKMYGTPDYHWIIMLLNQRYDYINDFPLNGTDLAIFIANKYGSSENLVHHFENSKGDVINGYCYIKITKKVKGNIEIAEGQSKITGYNTSFKEQLSIGNSLYTKDGVLIGVIRSITSNTELQLHDITVIPTYIGSFTCIIPIQIGDVIRNKTATGYAIGIVQEISNGNYGILMTSSSFTAGSDINILKYGDDATGNFIETSKGIVQITSISYPELISSDYSTLSSNLLTDIDWGYAGWVGSNITGWEHPIGLTTPLYHRLVVKPKTKYLVECEVNDAKLAQRSNQLISNGDWNSTNWSGNNSIGWTHSLANTTELSYVLEAIIGTKYNISIAMSNRTSGSITIHFGGVDKSNITASNTFDMIAISTENLFILPSSDFNGTIIITLKSYTVYSSGSINISFGGVDVSNSINKVEKITAISEDGLVILPTSDFIGNVKISIKSFVGEAISHISNASYEYLLNEKSREIKILPKFYLDQVLNEFNTLLLR